VCVCTDGKRFGGGLRCGEMESSALAAFGASRVLQKRTRENSDGYIVFICSECCLLTSSCEAISYFWCDRCDTDEFVLKIIMPYALLVLRYELACAGLSLRLKVTKDMEANLKTMYSENVDVFANM
jgi:DNA-directed RNA polymerase beta subunit